jgi:hypothetical protein
MYYVIRKLDTLSRATIHLNTHVYLIANGKCKEALEKIKGLIEVEAFVHLMQLRWLHKTFLFHHLFNEDGEGLVELLEDKKLY